MNNISKEFQIFDTRITQKKENLILKLGKVYKSKDNPLFCEDYFTNPPKKWEARFDNLYPSVIYDEEKNQYKLWYNSFIKDAGSENTHLQDRVNKNYIIAKEGQGREMGLLYAFSEDGINWKKPQLNLLPFSGSIKNNIVMNDNSHGMHGVGIFKDIPDPDPSRRYKAILKVIKSKMAVAFSEDGLHWSSVIQWPKYDTKGDTHNNALRTVDGTRFISFLRGVRDRNRVCLRSESLDFIHWSEPKMVFQGNDLHDQIYSMPVFVYGNIYLGLPAIFHHGVKNASDWDKIDTELAWSPDSVNWHRICPGESFIPLGDGNYPDGEYDCGCIYAATPLLKDEKHYLYYGGSNGLHTSFREGSFNLATLPRGRFAGYSVKKSSERGSLTTYPFKIEEGKINVNVEVFKGGTLLAGIINVEGVFLKGFGLEDFMPISSGGLDISLNWRRDLTNLAGSDVRLFIELNNVMLYSISGNIKFECFKVS